MLFEIQQLYNLVNPCAINISELAVSSLTLDNSMSAVFLLKDYTFLTTSTFQNFSTTSNIDPFLHPSSASFSTDAINAFSALVSDPIVYINIEPEYLDEEGLDIRYSFKYTLPDAKLTYPESHIASPSYLHQDLSYLCILQYWY